MSIMQSFRQLLIIIGFLFILAFGPVIFVGYADLSSAKLTVSAHERARYYESAARRLPWIVESYEMAGSAALAAAEYDHAIDLLQVARSKAVLTPNGQFELGKAYLSIGETKKAFAE